MDYMNMFRAGGGAPHHQPAYFIPQYTGQVSHPHQHQPPAQQSYPLPYTHEQLLVLAQMQQQRNMLNQQAVTAAASAAVATAAGGAGGANGSGSGSGGGGGLPGSSGPTKQTEPKPRLSKDEVELLEKEFQKNPKPSTGRKREIADALKVEQPRINNWFQNRRAKEKSLKKNQEFAARQAAEDGSKSPDTDDDGGVSEYYGLSDHHQPLQPSSAAFPDELEPMAADERPEGPQAHSDAGTSPADSGSMTSCDALAGPPHFSHTGHEPPESSSRGDEREEEYPSPKSLPLHHVDAGELDFTPLAPSFTHSHHNDAFSTPTPSQHQHQVDDAFPTSDGLNVAAFAPTNDHVAVHGLSGFGHFGAETMSPSETILAPTPSFPSQLLGRLEFHDMDINVDADSPPEAAEAAVVAVHADQRLQQQPSPGSMPISPPTPTDLRFKSPPPPANIASRRNKGVPAQLNATALRGYQCGPRTGLDLSMVKRSDAASPMRRIASATAPSMPVGIRKASLAATQAPRSPLYLERTKDAMIRSLQTARSPVVGSINTAMSPGTPSDPFLGIPASSTREPAIPSSASDDEGRYTFAAGTSAHAPTSFFNTLKTPPGTPGLNAVGVYSDQLVAPGSNGLNAFEAAWNFNPPDEPLVTPGLGSFGSEEFVMAPTAPGYVSGLGSGPGNSQPPTPSFPHGVFGPPPYGGPGNGYPWAFGPGGTGNTEYTFPDSYVPDASARSSPGLPQPKTKQFQFTQNVTPQDFNNNDKSIT